MYYSNVLINAMNIVFHFFPMQLTDKNQHVDSRFCAQYESD